MPVEIAIEHIDQVISSFDNGSRIVQEHVSDKIDTILGDMMRQLANEPPERVGQKYRRTHNLQHGWQEADTKWRLPGTAFLRNPTAYGPYVQDASMQAWMHRGRWLTVQDALAMNADRIEMALREAGDEAMQEIANR